MCYPTWQVTPRIALVRLVQGSYRLTIFNCLKRRLAMLRGSSNLCDEDATIEASKCDRLNAEKPTNYRQIRINSSIPSILFFNIFLLLLWTCCVWNKTMIDWLIDYPVIAVIRSYLQYVLFLRLYSNISTQSLATCVLLPSVGAVSEALV